MVIGMRDSREAEYLEEIQTWEEGMRDMLDIRIYGRKIGEKPNRYVIKAATKRLKQIEQDCKNLGYEETAERARQALRDKPKITLKIRFLEAICA